MSVFDLPTLARTIGGGTRDGHSLLQDWDIMVAYDEFSLNKLLDHQGKTAGAVQKVPKFTFTDTDDWGASTKYDYDLTLSNPTLQFLPETVKGDFLEVSFGLTGKISKNGDERSITAELDVTMTVKAPLVSAEGTVSKDGSFTADPKSVKDSSGIITTPPGKQNMVCISLQKNSLEGFKFTSTTPKGNKFLGNGNVLTPAINNLATHLDSAASLSFYLAGVHSATTAAHDAGATKLQPKCFMFSLVPAADPKKGGALCMYVCVENGVTGSDNKGGQKNGLGLLNPNTLEAVNPIPSGKGAAIYFNHTFIMNTIFIPSFKKAGLENLQKQQAYDPKKGIHFTFNMPSHTDKLPGGKRIKLPLSGRDQWNDLDISEVNFDIKDFQSDLFIATAPGTELITYNLTSDSKRVDWTLDHGGTDESAGSFGPGDHGSSKSWGSVDSGAFDLKLTWSGHSNWNSEGSTKTPSISTSFDGDIGMDSTPIKGETYFLANLLRNEWSNDLPSKWQPKAPKAPSISFSFPQLGYFLATNLLLPGANVFIPDPPMSGIAVPWDMIIAGSVVSSIPDSEKPSATAPLVNSSNGVSGHRPGPLAPSDASLRASEPTASADPNKSLEDKFLDELTAYSASNTLAPNVFLALQGDNIDHIETQIDQVLAKYGYQDLDADRLCFLTGFSLDSDIAFAEASKVMPAPTPRPSNGAVTRALRASTRQPRALAGAVSTAATTVDLSVYSGVYAIENGSKGGQLLVNPDTLEITYDGTTAAPTITDGKVTWSSGSSAGGDLVDYSITFTATRVGTTTIFQQSFSGTSTSSGSTAETFSGTKLASTPAFDIRLCAGTYKVSKPSNENGSFLYVDIVDGKIEWAGTAYQPTMELNTTTGATDVSWTTDDDETATYTISFYTSKGSIRFSGTVNNSGVVSEFEGEMQTDTSSEGEDETSSWSGMEVGAAAVDLIMTAITLGLMAKTFVDWRRHREMKKDPQITAKDKLVASEYVRQQNKSMVHAKGTMTREVKKAIKARVKDRDAAWTKMNSEAFNNGARAIIQKEINAYLRNEENSIRDVADVDGMNTKAKDFWDGVRKSLEEYVREQCGIFTKGGSMDPVPELWSSMLGTVGFSDSQIREFTKSAYMPKVDELVAKLMGEGIKADSWASARAHEVAAKNIKKDFAILSNEAQAEIIRYQQIQLDYPSLTDKANMKLNEIDEEINKGNLTEKRKKELETERAQIEDDMKEKKKEFKEAKDKLEEAREHKEYIDKNITESAKAEEKRREKGDRAAEKAFLLK